MRPNPYARGDHVRPRLVQATVGEPRIPWIDPWGASTKYVRSFCIVGFILQTRLITQIEASDIIESKPEKEIGGNKYAIQEIR